MRRTCWVVLRCPLNLIAFSKMTRIEWDLMVRDYPELKLPKWDELGGDNKRAVEKWPVNKREQMAALFGVQILSGERVF